MASRATADQDQQIISRIGTMVAAEKELRQQITQGRVAAETAQQRLTALETALDQCWDLLRQRRAREEFHEDPGQARVRPAAEVEGYLS